MQSANHSLRLAIFFSCCCAWTLHARDAVASWPVDPATNLAVSVIPGEQSNPNAVSDGTGGTIIVWEDYRGGATSDVYAQRIDADGVAMWADGGLPICTVAGHQARPELASDGAGGAILTWTDYRSGGGDIYIQRIDPTGSVLWAPTGFPICDDGQAQLGVKICSDGAGGAVLVWEDFRADGAGDLYAQRVNASGFPAWTINGISISSATGGQLGHSAVPNGSGGAIVVWRDLRVGWAGDIYAQNVAGNGSVMWATNGVAVCAATGGQYDPRLIAHPAGGALVTWSDERTGSADIYAQRVSNGGTALWATNGVQLCGAYSFQTFPVLAPDGEGGAIVAWEDARSDTTVDVYAQRVSAEGTSLWSADGVPVCIEAGWKSQPAIVPDLSGGAVLAWQDQRSLVEPAPGSLAGVRTRAGWLAARDARRSALAGDVVPGDDVYAQRLTADGVARWTVAGVAVSSASDAQIAPAVVPDGASGAIVTWYDYRNADWDIYAQQILADGSLGQTVGVPFQWTDPALRLAPPYPNPAARAATIRFDMPRTGHATLEVFDAAGRRVRRLHAGTTEAGSHVVRFDTRDDAGRAFEPGTYFLRLLTSAGARTQRLVTTR